MRLKCKILSIIILCGVSCSIVDHLPQIVEVNQREWYAPVQMTFDVSDTSSMFDVSVVLRYNNFISSDSVALQLTTIAPDGVKWSDRITIATPKGNDAIYTTQKLWRTSVKWQQKGIHTILFTPQQIYKGVTATGVSFED